MTEAALSEPPLLFRPDAFFMKPWRGWGVVRDGRGRPLSRYTAHGRGRAEARSATTEQVFSFDNGVVHVIEWEILSDDESYFYARDLRSGVEARGRQRGEDFVWRFHSRAKTPLGVRRVASEALYTMATPSAAFSFTRTSWWGMTLNTFSTFYEQV